MKLIKVCNINGTEFLINPELITHIVKMPEQRSWVKIYFGEESITMNLNDPKIQELIKTCSVENFSDK